ncbi:type II-A CRISPR-associated protein Csn2 [Xylocopilactobacillus apis]|uniref:Type II-A CRISPR-associated protein Csn2 n=1 Tax=Xylocopilactobacillus apis TaxID=2932183 RepID=A0AAU9D1L1_9LACO|nr:type II-A CRISPR-associated protein Csn2 [Xylocopilactobacillus apis]BDR56165.1 hypothetical protein KIMC2_07270 [Xylocopilactobacillus apis]
MTKSLTIFPFDPISLKNGYNSINIQNIPLFWKIINSLKEEDKDVLVFSENNKILDFSKYIVYLGDIGSCPSPKQVFYKQILKKLNSFISDESKHNIYLLDREIRNILSKEVFNLGLPLEVSQEWSFDDIIKMLDLSYSFHQNTNPIDLLNEFVDLSFYLGDIRILIFTNLSYYFSKEEFEKVVYELESKEVLVLSLNLSIEGISKNEADKHGCFIDSDFTMFTNW